MTSPTLSAPTLYARSDLKDDPKLVTQITDLVNEAFYRSKLPDPVKWRQARGRRFPTNDLYFEMLGQEGLAVVIFDNDAAEKKAVAVAAAVPWEGGWQKEGAGVEHGWEFKAVAVDGSSKYLHRGLAVKMYKFLEQYLVSRTQEYGVSTNGRQLGKRDQLTLWILAAECINGAYWKKRGYELVRRGTYGPPTWGCQTSFEMVVLRKNVPLSAAGMDHPTEVAKSMEELSKRDMVKVN
ncbi:uncharacterized protein EKO05_0010506 [Ascochyta rabiei]|uniref:N-acetyltransferase n=1 Tax=Didymella rabiei TaxID=5454 RepID=A0A163GPX7_DIDRA|nr:uncharacterized protein EKO05_0010506 [Ascochyta rabiei]KZM24954.1 N-acetyltransferase [Ascochyta rabiei]UPX20267.1 hypothetical protein EKO05_0010506 [Ascochyta rabiei]